MAKRDYYEVLGVEKNAGDEELKRAYRRLAKECHPDLHPEDEACEARFKEIGEAYQVLSDPQTRAQYDRYGHAGPTGGGFNFSEGFSFDMGDIFDAFFGGGFSSRSSRRSQPQRGGDIKQDVRLDFEEAVRGCVRELDVLRTELCPECDGTGAKPGTKLKSCPDCGGTGQISQTQNTLFGRFVNVATCTRCGGSGSIAETPCTACRGKKTVRRTRRISVSIPAGIDNGQAISLRGEGQAGENGGSSGDLYVRIAVRPHALFHREGYDLDYELPVTFFQAALGAEVPILTLEGEEVLKIPEGTQTGEVFRLKNRGVQRLQSELRGDLHITVRVETPQKLSEPEKKLLRELEDMASDGEYKQRKAFEKKMRRN